MPDEFSSPRGDLEDWLPADDEDTDRIAARVQARIAGTTDAADPGFSVGRYVDAEVRAHGGMGRVFIARDPLLDRTVALKALPVGLSPREPAAGASRREGKALARIDHPHVVRVLEILEHRGLECLVLEHLDGPSLAAWLRDGPRGWRAILQLFLQAGEGLAAVHRAGLVHRDFKPANVIVGRDGSAKLIDLGLALAPGSLRPGSDELCAGTPRYSAPEQIQRRQVDARSDQFSFCVALFEALFGHHPYLSADIERRLGDNPGTRASRRELVSRQAAFTQILAGELRRPQRAPADLPAPVVAALLRGLSLAPERRFPTMEALLAQLRRDPRRTRRRWLLGVAAAATLTAGLYAAVRPETCPAQDTVVAQLWRGRLAGVVSRLEAGPLAALIDAANDLAEANLAACDARVRGEHRDTDLARDVCLQTRAIEFDALLTEIESGDDTTAAVLARQIARQGARVCADPLRLRFSCADHPDATRALAEATVARLAGRYPRAADLAASALRHAETHGAVGSQARALIILGRIAYDQADWRGAREHILRARDLAQRNACRSLVADSYHWLTKLGAFDANMPLAQAQEFSRLHELELDDTDAAARADLLSNRGLLCWRRDGDLDECEALLRTAIGLRQGDLDRTVEQADSYLNLAGLLRARGQPAPALAALRAAQVRRNMSLTVDHPLAYKEPLTRGNLEVSQGRIDEALRWYDMALSLATADDPDAEMIGDIHLAIAQAHDRRGDRAAALAAAEAAVKVFSRLPDDDLRRSEAEEAVAQTLIAGERFEEALAWLARAEVQLRRPRASVKPTRLGILLFRWAEAYNGLGRHVEAEARARQAQDRFDEDGLAGDAVERAYAALHLAEALLGQGRGPEAIPSFEQAIEIWATRGDNPELLGWAQWGRSRSLCQVPVRRTEARQAAECAIRAFSHTDPGMARHVSAHMDILCNAPR